MSFWVYILRCGDGTYYVGNTDDLEARLSQHGSGEGSGYTSTRLPVQLVFTAEMPGRDEAFARERQVKSWSRAKKEALIASDWQRLSSLAWGRNRTR